MLHVVAQEARRAGRERMRGAVHHARGRGRGSRSASPPARRRALAHRIRARWSGSPWTGRRSRCCRGGARVGVAVGRHGLPEGRPLARLHDHGAPADVASDVIASPPSRSSRSVPPPPGARAFPRAGGGRYTSSRTVHISATSTRHPPRRAGPTARDTTHGGDAMTRRMLIGIGTVLGATLLVGAGALAWGHGGRGVHHAVMKRVAVAMVDDALDAAQATPEQRAAIHAARDRVFAAVEQHTGAAGRARRRCWRSSRPTRWTRPASRHSGRARRRTIARSATR